VRVFGDILSESIPRYFGVFGYATGSAVHAG
jgi:hypothetical protein